MLGPSWPYPRLAMDQAASLCVANSIRQTCPGYVFSRACRSLKNRSRFAGFNQPHHCTARRCTSAGALAY